MPRKVMLGDLSWKEFKRRSKDVRVAIIPTGATEQHGPHLPMQQDTASALAVARRVAERLYPGVIVTPPISVGVSTHHMSFPGTLSLAPGTFIRVVVDTCRSLFHHGIRNVLILNGHGGNVAALGVAGRIFRDEFPDANLWVVSYWEVIPRKTSAKLLKTKNFPGHSGEFETSIGLAIHPELVDRKFRVRPAKDSDMRPIDPYRILNFDEFTETGMDPLSADTIAASATKGEKLLGAAVEGVREIITQRILKEPSWRIKKSPQSSR